MKLRFLKKKTGEKILQYSDTQFCGYNIDFKDIPMIDEEDEIKSHEEFLSKHPELGIKLKARQLEKELVEMIKKNRGL